jgi:hypothetical protein
VSGPATGQQHGRHTQPESTARGDRHGSRVHPECLRRGTRHPGAKLNEDDVRAIRRMRADGMTLEGIGGLFGVSYRTIWQVVARRTWRHIQ